MLRTSLLRDKIFQSYKVIVIVIVDLLKVTSIIFLLNKLLVIVYLVKVSINELAQRLEAVKDIHDHRS